MRLLIIDKTAGLSSSHERHQALANTPEIDLHVFGPHRWIENEREVIWQPRADQRYGRHVGEITFPGYYARHFYYRGLVHTVQKVQPDVIQLLEEPWSLVAGQLLAYSFIRRRCSILFYTWENIYRPWTYPSRLSPLYARIDRRMHRMSRGAICATYAAEDVLHRKGYFQPTTVIPYGISSDFFSDSPPERDPDCPFTIGYVGRMLRMKGVDLLLRAIQTIEDARLVLIGAGDYEPEIRRQTAELNLQDRVDIHSAMPAHEVAAHLRCFDALVLPSRTVPGWKEQLGRALIEAMATGVPAIGSRCGAIPEVLGREDLVFAEENVDELTTILNRLRRETGWRQEIIEYGRRRAKERFAWEVFAANTTEFYRRLGLL